MDKMKNLKKKLFIGGAYLVLALLLLIYVSYSAYRISIEAEVVMPEALPQRASLEITYYSQEDGLEKDEHQVVLNDLKPNEEPDNYMEPNMTLAEAKELGRAVTFTVTNADWFDENVASSSQISKLKTKYTLKLVETGDVPLFCVLVDESGNQYVVRTGDKYAKRNKIFNVRGTSGKAKSNGTGEEAVFEFGNENKETHNYTLYFGWDNNKGVTDASRRQEIASIEIQADVVEQIPMFATGSETGPEVHWYYSTSTPSSATTPSNGTP